jgi:hypothetical protein
VALELAVLNEPAAGALRKEDADRPAQGRRDGARTDLDVVRVGEASGGVVGNLSDRLVRPGVVDPKGGASAGNGRSFRGWTG